jgi:AcrR family transcriptional regulator
MQSDTVGAGQTDDKQAAILMAAFDAFRTYGFRRASMEDIARRAGMSRASIYLKFKNKEAILSALVQRYFDDAVEKMTAALDAAGDPADALAGAFAVKVAAPFDALMTSPHGEELMDAKITVAADVAAAGEARIVEVLADWLGRAEGKGIVSLEAYGSAEQTAATIYDALHGVVMSARDYDVLLADLDRLATLIGQGLRPARS